MMIGADGTYPNGSTGGSSTHTLTESEMPSHTHSSGWYGPRGADGSATTFATISSSYPSVETGSTGGGGAHNNMSPYIAVYMWKRTV
jgi:microcystin-dependent protein